MGRMGGSGESDVLVIGAGPAGLFAALELARHGVRARVVERAGAFRAVPADRAGLRALDAHLDSYLVPAAG